MLKRLIIVLPITWAISSCTSHPKVPKYLKLHLLIIKDTCMEHFLSTALQVDLLKLLSSGITQSRIHTLPLIVHNNPNIP